MYDFYVVKKKKKKKKLKENLGKDQPRPLVRVLLSAATAR